MKNYISPGTSPTTNYIRFTDEGNDKSGGSGGGSSAGLGGLADNLALLGFEKRNERNSRENIGNSSDNKSINKNIEESSKNNNISDDTFNTTIVIPFYVCLIDIVIKNNLYVEVVDNSSVETKNKVLANGKIKKYRINGSIKDFDTFIEFDNENVFRVNRRGIMMKIKVSNELKKYIINTMVNYVGDGGDVDTRKTRSNSGDNRSGGRSGNIGNNKGGCFGWLSCFKS